MDLPLNATVYNYLGYGLFLTAFCPYFLHLYPSSSWSTSLFVMKANLGSFCFFSPFFLSTLLFLYFISKHILSNNNDMLHHQLKSRVWWVISLRRRRRRRRRRKYLPIFRAFLSWFFFNLSNIFLSLSWIFFFYSSSFRRWGIRDRWVKCSKGLITTT